ncbi:MAG: excisionase [Paraburkholderia tropica]|nr:excisionase [Paraburkholderia tropica]
MKIRLEDWLRREFDPPPAVVTAYRWIKEKKIFPAPQKVGRAYYVDTKAVYRNGVQKLSLAERAFGNGS